MRTLLRVVRERRALLRLLWEDLFHILFLSSALLRVRFFVCARIPGDFDTQSQAQEPFTLLADTCVSDVVETQETMSDEMPKRNMLDGATYDAS